MTINNVLVHIETHNVSMSLENGNLVLDGSPEDVDSIATLARKHKFELIKIILGETVIDVGNCDVCTTDLLGLVTFDRYVNRVCPKCDKWFRCLEPDECKRESIIGQIDHQLVG